MPLELAVWRIDGALRSIPQESLDLEQRLEDILDSDISIANPGWMVIGRQPQRAPDGAPVRYERHRPKQTTLYRLVQEHAVSFIAHTEASTGSELPQFIKDEFDAFLECGILAHGFLRLRCDECGHDKLLAFSCKRRGFCPSCGARRMSQTAAHLVDHVIPHVSVRQ